jgi:hypothetical protein
MGRTGAIIGAARDGRNARGARGSAVTPHLRPRALPSLALHEWHNSPFGV